MLACLAESIVLVLSLSIRNVLRDHPFKTSVFFRGRGVKNLPNLPTDSSKKTANGRGIGVKNREKFANVLNGWSLIRNDP